MFARFLMLSALLYSSLAIPAFADDTLREGGMTIHVATNGGNCDTCEWLQLDGVIPYTAAESFEKWLPQHGGGTIYLNSPGGSLAGALELGRAFRRHGIATAVGESVRDEASSFTESLMPGKCASACAYAFLGGATRTATDGEVGVHRYFDPTGKTSDTEPLFSARDMAKDQAILARLLEYVHEMGVSSEFLRAASATPSYSVHYFSTQELVDYGVTVDSDVIKGWQMVKEGEGLALVAHSSSGTLEADLFCARSNRQLFMLLNYLNVPKARIGEMKDTISDDSAFFGNSPRPFTLGDVQIALSSSGPSSDTTFSLAFLLSPDQVSSLQKIRGTVQFFPEAAHAYQGLFSVSVSMTGFADYVALVARNCI